MNEWQLIQTLQKELPSPSKNVVLGIGDDAALCRFSANNLLLTVDAVVEGVHFDLRYWRPAELGHKALAQNLSDIAAMGGKPKYALVSLGLRNGLGAAFVRALYQGIGKLAKQHEVEVVGGNLSRTPKSSFCSISLIGENTGKILERKGAKVGDVLAVTGTLGSSALGWQALKKWGRRASRSYPESVRSHLLPQPKLEEGLNLANASGVTAMIDISDGLSSEIHHLASCSKVGFEVQRDWVPMSPEAIKLAKTLQQKPIEAALHGGEDYELLLTVTPSRLTGVQRAMRALGKNLVVIGEARPARMGVRLKTKTGKPVPLMPKGWRHF